MTYRKLPVEFKQKGFLLIQVWRDDNFAIYRQVRGKSVRYEVIKIRVSEGGAFWDVVYPPGEYYPSTSAWGKDGWTCLTLEEAQEKLALLSSLPIDSR